MVADQFETFLFDLDGVVYVGDAPVPEAVDVLGRLREQGKTLRFLTNDPRTTRLEVVRRLRRIGIEARVGEVVTCGWATAVHLREASAQTAYVVGSEGLRHEIESEGIAVADQGTVDAVVVGCDETVAYPHIRRATRQIRQGAQFIATNNDPTFPSPAGPTPATGAIVAAVRTASATEPHVVGKPEPPMFNVALDGHEVSRAVMIGDRLATDIAGAQRCNVASLWFNYGGSGALPDDPSARPSGVLTALSGLFDSSGSLS